jgi:hypothetical protein
MKSLARFVWLGSLVVIVFITLLAAAPVWATDTWTAVRPGVDWLDRTTGGATPQAIQAVRVDLSRSEVGLRASMDIQGVERGVGTDTFAQNVGALVAIDGDWSDGFTPVGLAIGNGFLWQDHFSNPSIGSQWGTFGCDVWNGCTIEALPVLPELFGYAPLISPLRYYNAIGTNGLLLIQDGVRTSGCYDGCSGDSCRHPRSAICLEEDGTHLWFIVADGRRSGASGMTCGEMRDLAEDLECWDAAMLDGGGSSALWIDGAIRNVPSDGSPRNVANHIGIVYADAPDSVCPFPAGAWCEGSVLRTCNGSLLVNEGDCAAFGTACQEEGDWAFCVSPDCPGGDGMGSVCSDATVIEVCTDGVYGSGDCGVFGLVCGTDESGSSCMDTRCEAGPNSAFCTAEDVAASCAVGVYSETADCAPGGLTCWTDGASSSCMDPACAAGPNASYCSDDDTVASCTSGVFTELQCEQDQTCGPTAEGFGCVDMNVDDDKTDDTAQPDPSPEDGGGCGCSAGTNRWGATWSALLLIGLAVVARRRTRS